MALRGEHEDIRACWDELIAAGMSIPLFKILDSSSNDAAFQTRHLSFQEYLCATTIREFVSSASHACDPVLNGLPLFKWFEDAWDA